MTTHNHTTHHEPTGRAPDDPRALEEELAQQREELARTVQDLHDRLDLKTRTEERAAEMKEAAQERVHEMKDRATTAKGRPRPGLIAAGAVVVAVPLAALAVRSVWRHRQATAVPMAFLTWKNRKGKK